MEDISCNLTETTPFIESQISQFNPDKTYFVGNSMGGYAALMFSSLIGIGEVIAFAPQTFISPLLRWKYKDDRWKNQILKTYKKSFFRKNIWDLKPLLLRQKVYQKKSVYISKEDMLDCIHASHISSVPGVIIHEFESGGHEIVTKLRDEGKLPLIMTGCFSG